jgi:hypothetical protein
MNSAELDSELEDEEHVIRQRSMKWKEKVKARDQ